MTTNAHQIRHNHGNKKKTKKHHTRMFALRCTFIYHQNKLLYIYTTLSMRCIIQCILTSYDVVSMYGQEYSH